MTITFAEVLGAHGITIPDDTLAELEVPVITGLPQRQGDVAIVPRKPATSAELSQMAVVPAEGVQVVRGEATGNTHLLHASGECRFRPVVASGPSTLLGVLTVAEGAECFLIHTDEHGANGIGPGTYELRGKREQADQIRRVQD